MYKPLSRLIRYIDVSYTDIFIEISENDNLYKKRLSFYIDNQRTMIIQDGPNL